MKKTWKDVTSYARGERGNVDPSTWELDLSGLRVCVSAARECMGDLLAGYLARAIVEHDGKEES